jgi:hypothetical protein
MPDIPPRVLANWWLGERLGSGFSGLQQNIFQLRLALITVPLQAPYIGQSTYTQDKL